MTFVLIYLILSTFIQHSHSLSSSLLDKTTLHVKIFQYLSETKGLDNIIKIDNNRNDVLIEEIQDGMTNYCFKISSKKYGSVVFLKHATDSLKLSPHIKLTPNRLQCEYKAIKAYAKYTPQVVPKVLHFDDDEKYLFNEFLDGYDSLTKHLIDGEVSVDCCRAMGTVMGRSHARTYYATLPAEQMTRLLTDFSNDDHLSMWNNDFFQPCLDRLNRVRGIEFSSETTDDTSSDFDEDDLDLLLAEFLSHDSSNGSSERSHPSSTLDALLKDHDKDGQLGEAIEALKDIYNHKKECLVHGDLNSNNVLIRDDKHDGDDKMSPFKGTDCTLYMPYLLLYYS